MRRPRRVVETSLDGVRRPSWHARLSRFCATALREAGCREWDVSLLLCGDERMAALNARYRGRKGATDVLSFPRAEPPGGAAAAVPQSSVEGDLAICMDTLRRNAAAYGCTVDEELKRVTVHGILHLAGMDHGRGRGGPMLALQERLLESLHAERIIGERPK